MSHRGSHRDNKIQGGVTRCCFVRGKLLPGLMLITLVRTAEALATEQVIIPPEPSKPDLQSARDTVRRPALLFGVPPAYRAGELPETREFSARDFRPRGRTASDGVSPAAMTQEAPMLRSTTVWQRLAEFRTHGRVRLLTLWETGDSSVSLQAGKKGEPSLQWTSRLMNHGGATRGVLDQLVSTSIAGAGRSMHFTPRANAEQTAARPAAPPESGTNK